MINKIIQQQLKLLTTVPFKVDGEKRDVLPESFKEIVFEQDISSVHKDNIIVIFEDYIIKPFKGFDLHQKWNNNIPPYDKKMYGNIIKETEKMYQLDVHSETSNHKWIGWCPKKSCKIIKIGDN